MKIIAEFPTPEGAIVVTRESGTYIPVVWVVTVPGLGRHKYGRKRDAMHHARAAIRLLAPPTKFDLVKAWDKVREYT